MASTVEQLPLWTALKSKGKDDQRATVKKLIDRAAPILDRIIETFPTYTVHNATHAENVVRLMANLLGPRLEDLQPLEAAMLILAAYYHDIGMVFHPDERAKLVEEEHWKQFLDEHPEAYLAVEKSDAVPEEIAEWYCRWRHADRVFVYLNDIPDQDLEWNGISIREQLGNLCRSHSWDVQDVHRNPTLQTNFLEAADLRFCAVILRLADILDFDDSRSPPSVYRYLDLSTRETPIKDASDLEWRKHLASQGFVFPKNRDQPYELGFTAGPDDPAVEHDVRQFLDTIQGEIERCTGLLKSCSDRWSNFVLPIRIKRDNIQSKNYQYGQYRFTLEQDQVLELFMGENLYEDPHVFVRELLQNALDASRHREFVERALGNQDFKAKPINVREWRDAEGYNWVRFDDFGMGMDQDIVQQHLLKVGSSYYKTPRFERDILEAQKNNTGNFVPISRFGIGLLSCFIAGDRVEINTLHKEPDGKRASPVRLALHGLHGFFTLQMPDNKPNPMPSPDDDTADNTFRGEPGTSIAVRLDPRKEQGSFELGELLNKYLFCPPVPVEFEGRQIGGDPGILVDKPWCERRSITLRPEEMAKIEEFLGHKFKKPWEVELIPIDLTKHSPTPELRGQFIRVQLRPNEEWPKACEFLASHMSAASEGLSLICAYRPEQQRIDLIVRLRYRRDFAHRLAQNAERIRHDAPSEYSGLVSKILDKIGAFLQEHPSPSPISLPTVFQQECIISLNRLINGLPTAVLAYLRNLNPCRPFEVCHNGGRIAWKETTLAITHSIGAYDQYAFDAPSSFGAVVLSDSLRPEFATARDRVHKIPWSILSGEYLAWFGALQETGDHCVRNAVIGVTEKLGSFTESLLGEMLDDPLLTRNGPWSKQPIFNSRDTRFTFRDIEDQLAAGKDVILRSLPPAGEILLRQRGFLCYVAAVMAYSHLRLAKEDINSMTSDHIVLGLNTHPVPDGLKLFPPMAFIEFLDSAAFRSKSTMANRKHALSQWLIEVAPQLAEKYPGILESIRTAIFGRKYYSVTLQGAQQLRETVNQALDRLASLDASLRPPKSIYLKPDDIDLT